MREMGFMEKLLDGVAVNFLPLANVTNYEQPTKYLVAAKNYSDDFDTPVLTAGKTFILGYTDESEGIYRASEHPVIIFDDFTTANKWVDFDFKAKSSAMKMITSKDNEKFLLKYIYYWLNTLPNELIDGDHKRQWIGNYSNKLIPIPCPDNPKKSLEIQAEIVRILDAMTAHTAELTAELTARKKQYNYYRDKLLSFEGGEVEWKTLGAMTRISSASRVHKNQWTTSGVPFFRTSDVISIFNGVKNSRDDAFISHELYEELSLKSGKTEAGDILVTGGGTIGIPYIVPNNEPLYYKDADLLCIKKLKEINSKFLYHYFLSTQFRVYLEKISHNSTIAHYTISQIEKTPVPVPSLDEQNRIVTLLDKFDALTASITEGLPREIELRQKQYAYYRDLLLSFPKPPTI